MSLLNKIIRYWVPPVIWMTIIFYLSSQQKVSITYTYVFDFMIFKALHMIEYAILYFLLFRGFYSIDGQQLTINNKLIFPLFLAILYAVLDEFHQTFIPTREGRIRDVVIDASGILLMYIYIKTHFNSVKKFL